MPDLNGYEAMDRLQNDEITRPVPVLAISAFGQSSDSRENTA